MVVIPHSEVIEFVCGSSHGIGLAEGGLESLLEGIPIGGKFRKVVIFEFEGGFVPPLGGILEPRSGVGNLDSVSVEIIGATSED